MCLCVCVCVSLCKPHLWEELIVIVFQYPHFRLQLPDVVGGRIWRRDEEEKKKRRGEVISISKTSSGKRAGRATEAEGPQRAPKVAVQFEMHIISLWKSIIILANMLALTLKDLKILNWHPNKRQKVQILPPFTFLHYGCKCWYGLISGIYLVTYIGIKRKMASAFRRLKKKKIVIIVVKISSLILIF